MIWQKNQRFTQLFSLVCALGTSGLAACSGKIGLLGESDGRTGDSVSEPPPIGSPERPEGYGEEVNPLAVSFECDDAADPSITRLKRLTVRQYENTLRDLLSVGETSAAFDAARGALDQLPIDGEDEASFKLMDSRLSQRHVDGFFNVADAISSAIVDTPSRLAALGGDCATATTVDSSCLRSFVEDFGQRVFRRPLSDAEVARYLELDEPGAAAQEVYRGVLFTLLMAPQFLYQLEVGGTPIDGRAEYLELSPWELASRLSYHFWQTMPDDELFAAAANGSLLEEPVYLQQVERLWNDPRTEATVQAFYADWYRLDVFGGFATTPAFATFASGVAANDTLYWDSAREMEALIRHYTFDPGLGSYRDILTSNLVFADSPALANLYGVAPWDGASAPVPFPAANRSGLLTRAAMLISSNHATNPFKRGAFVRRELLCTPVEPPANLPADALNPPPFEPDASTRERFENKVAPDECMGCHKTFMPFGFALEAYDGLGRYRTEETIIDQDGQIITNVPVDTTADIEIVPGEVTNVTGPVQMSEALAESGLAEECFARHYFRYTFRRNEAIGDECVLASILQNVQATPDGAAGGLKRAMLELALEEDFKRRVVE